MSIIDNLKDLGKSSKEKAVLGALSPAMSLIEGWTKDIKPENPVADFINESFGILFESKSSDDMGGITKLLSKMSIAEANEDPIFVEDKLLRFYEAFRIYYHNKIELEKQTG